MTANHQPSLIRRSPRRLRLGFVALTDGAPLIAAQELGLFSHHGVEVELRREVGWATVRDKVIFGELDAAQAPAPLLWSAQLGLGGPRCDVLTALVLNLHGNAITLSSRLHSAGVSNAATFRTEAHRRRGEARLTLGIVYPFSSHHLQLRQWLLAAGLDPEKDVRIVVVPPAQMFRNLAAGTLDGYCAGEPWGSVAVQAGQGWCPTWSARLSPGHVEKVLMVRAEFADDRSAEHFALVAALNNACAWCDEPDNRPQLAEWLAEPRYLDVSAQAIRPALTGRFDNGAGQIESVPDFHIFSRGGANLPTPAAATALQHELSAAGLLPSPLVPTDLPSRLFRVDLYRAATSSKSDHTNDNPPSSSRLKSIETCLS
jgi:ABC-type nitrate/sulfonate/bicarbonate transport system substrate-binding protein